MRLTDEVGLATERRLDHARADGFDLDRLRAAFITRTHADHEGGAGLWVEATGAQIAAHPVAAAFIHAGNEAGFNVTVERAAGGNPSDYCLQPVANVRSLADGEDVRIGTLRLSVIRTPGHSAGGACYLEHGRDRTYLFTGDTLFFGGKVLILSRHDSSVVDLRRSVARLASLRVDALLPGHLLLTLPDGGEYVRQALAAFEMLLVPGNIL
jgi:glyoxylase-like metal-dependent hydrolase (beta-lactamase superfamily II)